MARLAQLLPIMRQRKADTIRELTDLYHQLQKPVLLSGLRRTYRPILEGGEELPPEATNVQVTATEAITSAAALLTSLFDITLTCEDGDTLAKADIMIDGERLATDVPVTYLLFLEKELLKLRTTYTELPILDPADQWHFDPNANLFVTDPTETARSKPIPRNHEIAPATEKHPAQVQVYQEQVVQGYWKLIKMSGAIPAARKALILRRVNRLLEAVKSAREEANNTAVPDRTIGADLFKFILAE